MTERICKDCKNYVGDFCLRGQKKVGVHPVDGSPIYKYPRGSLWLAYLERWSIFPWNCGKKGRHFEKKDFPGRY
jgi:hypothetical protein